ncbi:MAG: replicative DNA helicase, partial [Pseudomonadales bacterium]|nr:replicative DNA helicase [Pseudomonadales bacterium]
MSTSAAKLPPHNLEAENSVLGSILIDSDAIFKVADIISEKSFYQPAYQIIYKAMRVLYESNQPIDAVTLTNQLKKTKELKTVGGSAVIAGLANDIVTSANVAEYAKIVSETAVKRHLISLGSEMTELAFDEGKEVVDILDEAEQKIFSVSQSKKGRSFIHIKDTLAESFERIDQMQRNGDAFQGLPTGFTEVDNVLAGMHPSNLIILAARPGTGKTAFALNIAHHLSIKEKKKVAFFSLEMSKEELVDRLLVNQADVDAFKMKTGRLDPAFDIPKIAEAMGVLAEAEIFIDDTPGLSIFEMRTQARRLMAAHNIDFLVVDYLQLASGRTKDNRVTEVAEISQG